MKVLTIEQKAIAYDEAIDKIKYVMEHGVSPTLNKEDLQDIFPELKESEDEKIRKDIISALKWANHKGVYDKHIAWLEKQGKKKLAEKYNITGIKSKHAEGKLGEMIKEMKSTDEVKPKFKVGDVVINKKSKDTVKIVQILHDSYCYSGWDGAATVHSDFSISEQNNWELVELKPADKVEPKFKVGDIITNGKIIGKVDENENNKYHGWFGYNKDLSVHYADIPDVENWHLWTIQDAKDGDVLVNQNGEMPFIFKECKNNHIYCYCGYTNRKDIFFDRFVDSEGEELHWLNLYHEQAYPATKEQRDTLMKAMADAGYEWDAKKKELNKVEQKTVVYIPKFHVGDKLVSTYNTSLTYDVLEVGHINGLGNPDYKVEIFTDGKAENPRNIHYMECYKVDEWAKLIEQKHAWSEEDEAGLGDALWAVQQARTLAKDENDMGNLWYAENWLNALKGRLQPKQEWSEEDEEALEVAIIALEDMYSEDSPLDCYAGHHMPFDKAANQLKSLKERVQPKQEWSEEDESYLNTTIAYLKDAKEFKKTAENCIDWLKSLRPQNRWKPTENQIKALHDLNITGNISNVSQGQTLIELYNDLKKL